MDSIKIGIVGYGNLGKGVQCALSKCVDMELVAVFTRRKDLDIPKAVHIDNLINYVGKIDVMILCGGSATDLPEQGPAIAKLFNTIDSFDTHAKIPDYFECMDKVLMTSQKTGIISAGWDPGMFSIHRMMSQAILPDGEDYTFWGKGVSQGHSDAIRRIEGVIGGIQYTVPVQQAINAARSGDLPELTAREKHKRECFVVAHENADKQKIELEIKNMPNYFADYDTSVTFITQQELEKNHKGMPHGGFVIRSGKTNNNTQIMEYSLKLDSNPEFTASVLVAYARAAHKMSLKGMFGCHSVFDVPPAMLSPKTSAELRKQLL